MMISIKRYASIFFLLILFYCLSLGLAFSIPNHMLKEEQQNSLQLIQSEGDYPSLNYGNRIGTRLDNYTDRSMIGMTEKYPDKGILENIMFINYPRYWHGYLIILRPLLAVMNYGNIRMLYSFILLIFIALNFYFIANKGDIYLGISFLISLAAANIEVFSFSMQFSNILLLTLLANLFVLFNIGILTNSKNLSLLFFAIGSLTAFFDLLTMPLISWGIPIMVIFYIRSKYLATEERTLSEQGKELIITSLTWGTGYGLTWFTKWCLASLILRQNVIKDAFTQILFRTGGNDKYPLHRLDMLKENFLTMYPKISLLIIILCCFFFLGIAYHKNRLHSSKSTIMVLLLIAFSPYIWYNILASHSQIHFWFTYRLQMVTSLGILASFAYLIPPGKDKF